MMILLMYTTPLIYLYLRKRKLAWASVFLLLLYTISWSQSLQFKGTNVVNWVTGSWISLLVIMLVLLLIAVSLLVRSWFALSTRAILVSALVIALLAGFIYLSKWFVWELLELLLYGYAPLYILLLFVIGLITYER